MSSASGRCLCGALTFSATLPTKWVAHCHCTRCQRAHGAAFVTWAGFEASRVAIQDPNDVLCWYSVEGGGDRGFCARCGASIFFKAEAWPGELHIARAAFVDDLDRAPQAHVYFDTHVDWVTIADELPKKPDPHAK